MMQDVLRNLPKMFWVVLALASALFAGGGVAALVGTILIFTAKRPCPQHPAVSSPAIPSPTADGLLP